MKARTRRRTAYHRLVRSFDHSDLAALPRLPRAAPGARRHRLPGAGHGPRRLTAAFRRRGMRQCAAPRPRAARRRLPADRQRANERHTTTATEDVHDQRVPPPLDTGTAPSDLANMTARDGK